MGKDMRIGERYRDMGKEGKVQGYGERGFDHRVSHFWSSGMVDGISKPPVLQRLRYFYLGRRLPVGPTPRSRPGRYGDRARLFTKVKFFLLTSFTFFVNLVLFHCTLRWHIEGQRRGR